MTVYCQVLRHNPHISQSVSQILSTYDAQARQEPIQGKPAQVKKSGRFNTTDTVTAAPEARWPNEGYLGVSGKKRIAYDELALPEWAVGQLYNVFHIQDPTTARHTYFCLRMPRLCLIVSAVRSAWGNSMHEVGKIEI